MATTIQVSKELLNTLKSRKMYDKESYEDIIWVILEDTMELSAETKKNIEISKEQIRKGKTIPFSEVKKKLRI